MRLGPLLPRDEDVLLALGFLDLVVQLPQRTFELLGLFAVLDPRVVQLHGVLDVLVVAQQRLLGEVVAAFLYREHGALLPIFGQLLFLLGLRRQALLVGDRGGDLLFGFRQLAAHVNDQLLEHLLRVLGARNQIVDVRPDQRGQTINDPHLGSWQ